MERKVENKVESERRLPLGANLGWNPARNAEESGIGDSSMAMVTVMVLIG